MIMCDGTNSFSCEHGAICEEIVQGEKYSCKCPSWFAGEHCEQAGVPCGQIFCFHHAQCLDEAGYVYQCPSNWKGSDDCSIPTTSTGSYPLILTTHNSVLMLIAFEKYSFRNRVFLNWLIWFYLLT